MASFKSFVCEIDNFLHELKATNPVRDSKSWYLVNHLSKLSYNCHSSTSAKEVNNSVKSLLRFAVDSLDWDSELSNKVNRLAEYHASLIKACE
ncbi:hypothetical protein [Shewanella phaeophyticola]|jgi:uncharacterized coiled-coil DUF342 family protein|uniref:Uncharacterized protein n=1 Tax=Shewanella phaeophyticola TaxID=2978345 RepID=A0ABT2NYB2_9GAMM|nr:hypothetical protein [Shewanella sp. KJ10-1]MCT8985388.1 hypothetical protein [Shewanella sp. KJ10-1]